MYLPKTDSIITVSSTMHVESYKYHVLAASTRPDVSVSVCKCVNERERERERDRVFVCVIERDLQSFIKIL
jgi:hypothetical protein